MADSIIINKCASIERCLKRIREDYQGPDSITKDFTRQDAIILNLQRACEQSIDLANHLVKKLRLGIPKNSKEAFELLQEQGILNPKLALKLSKMVSFRNIAIHEYTKLNQDILVSIVEQDLGDFESFIQAVSKFVED